MLKKKNVLRETTLFTYWGVKDGFAGEWPAYAPETGPRRLRGNQTRQNMRINRSATSEEGYWV